MCWPFGDQPKMPPFRTPTEGPTGGINVVVVPVRSETRRSAEDIEPVPRQAILSPVGDHRGSPPHRVSGRWLLPSTAATRTLRPVSVGLLEHDAFPVGRQAGEDIVGLGAADLADDPSARNTQDRDGHLFARAGGAPVGDAVASSIDRQRPVSVGGGAEPPRLPRDRHSEEALRCVAVDQATRPRPIQILRGVDEAAIATAGAVGPAQGVGMPAGCIRHTDRARALSLPHERDPLPIGRPRSDACHPCAGRWYLSPLRCCRAADSTHTHRRNRERRGDAHPPIGNPHFQLRLRLEPKQRTNAGRARSFATQGSFRNTGPGECHTLSTW